MFRAFIIACALCIGSIASEPERAKERVVIKTLVGKVKVVSPDSTKTKRLRVGMRIPIGWQVRTGVESWVELMFESGTIIRLGESSVITLSEELKENKEEDK